MKTIPVIMLLFTALCFGQEPFSPITDYEFTNQSYTINDIHKFLDQFPNNRLTDEEIWFGYWQCRAWTIHFLVWMATMEKESSIVSVPESISDTYKWRHHRCMGYGLIKNTRVDGKKYYKYGFYTVQVHAGIRCLRKLFDEGLQERVLDSPEPGWNIDDGSKLVRINSYSGYSIVRYTPYSKGIEDFNKIYQKFKRIWNQCQTSR